MFWYNLVLKYVLTATQLLSVLQLWYYINSTKRNVHLVWFYTLSVSERQLFLRHRRHPGVVPARHALLPARLEGVKTRKKKCQHTWYVGTKPSRFDMQQDYFNINIKSTDNSSTDSTTVQQ